MKKRIAILGSTGSIGVQSLEVIEKNLELFSVEVLTANNNSELLIKQAIKFEPNVVVIANEEKYKEVSSALAKFPIKVYSGENSIQQVVEMDTIDIVITAMVGFSGLKPTINAIKSKKNIALANKETLVVAGELIKNLCVANKVSIVPVDSEHSAIFQCLVGEQYNLVEKIYLTASGGPFREKDYNFLKSVKKEQALKHPNWNMGNKVTIDSSSLMNKGLEAIEAKWLFNLKPEQIEVIVHPQSIIHSMVQFEDGSIKAQMGLPDMRLPIQYALSFPDRIFSHFERFDFMKYPTLSFSKPNTDLFRNLALAYFAMKKGGNMPCILNAANEIVVEAFLQDKIGFLEMPEVIEKTMNKINFIKNPSLDDYIETNKEARDVTKKMIKK
ncbi:MAG TPA: 1-deoxy-D-xylulose-5-phosphate reductoisomerase [Bacteroidales bacterium]|nr:MAG: 1-deoxy-D-xylulose-5-phosphate reductoisomerase [Bacteroidetes bacterium GWF2_33_38]OFY76591.1 MAG: 1-deoxy-D-xylulose-5-phosphate reductoisomerase [Bacteroidetes bacterium RIFOXYA12_FULL_33_9]HBF88037.1 1-deoxy-D-xylulose-5-phosphate reductoisomerase [Bacteroidales bacterium]